MIASPAMNIGAHLAVTGTVALLAGFFLSIVRIAFFAQGPDGWTLALMVAAGLVYLFAATKGFGGLRER